MKLSVHDWMEMPVIVLPWEGKETGFTLQEVRGVCAACGSELEQMRGHIYEFCGVIEMEVAGICPKCNCVIPSRNRIYPKTGEFAEQKNIGWERIKMRRQLTFRQIWILNSLKAMLPMGGGLGVAVIVSAMCLEPTKWTYLWWGVIVIGFAILASTVGYFTTRRK